MATNKPVNYEQGDLLPSSEKESLQSQLIWRRRKLAKLREQRALFGIHAPPHLHLQIEDEQEAITQIEAYLSDPTDKPTPAAQYFSKGTRALIVGDLWEAQRFFKMTLTHDEFFPRASELLELTEKQIETAKMRVLTHGDLHGSNIFIENLGSVRLIPFDSIKSIDHKPGKDGSGEINFSGADLLGVNLRGLDLRGVNLSGAILYRADLSRTNLIGANLSWADLRRAKLNWADLTGANLQGAYLYEANLRGANLHLANLSWADLCGANLSGMYVRWIDLSWAKYDDTTKF